ncbi:ribosome production factor 1 [Alosa sapidissima]|uniref:ribosome production factor 1 n=1 Tax=Alosa sapidissima TaxID=34773 RepID=UPI001C09A98A|nr:ribosome production factor 1 [Alosa sapidissima]XP_041912553.1 ribosome production factor 1 [Alosa sapidissima]
MHTRERRAHHNTSMDKTDLPEENMDFEEESEQRTVKKKKDKGKKSTKVKKSQVPVVKKDEIESRSVDTEPGTSFPPTFSVSEIKNKQRRHVMFMKLKQEKRKQRLEIRKKRKKEREALGDKAPPKEVPKTIENQRIYDETTVDPQDEEVAFDEGTDEFSAYFNRLTNPKVLITTSDRPKTRTIKFCDQLATVIPDAHVYYRRGLALKRIIPQCVSRGFTYLLVINEDRKVPNGMVLCHLPDGPTAHFKISNVRLRKEMKRRGKEPTEHSPEVILNNFTTRLGHSIGRLFAALYPHDPHFVGRQVATFHNQRDFIFFRFHRYIFKNEKKVGIQELGPRFTLKLRSLQKGTFDSKFGEYEWVHKRHEMDTSRRKFHL